MGTAKSILSLLLIALLLHLQGQVDSIQKPLLFYGYIDAYYTYDFNKPTSGNRPAYYYNFTSHNKVNCNLAFIKLAYQKNRFRFNIAPMLGTYAVTNLAAEPVYLRHIFEANLGVKLSAKKSLWFDAGIFPSHIGFESAISKDCATLTRSLLAENTPYFETGVKLTYEHNSKFTIAALAVNGWQKIKWPEGKSLPSFGLQATYKPTEKLTLNYSNFIGTDYADSIRKMRYYHNLYAIWNLHDKIWATAGFDIGMEQKHKGSEQYNIWYSPVLIVRYLPVQQFAVAIRYEYYNDAKGAMIVTSTANGFQTHGMSLNADYIISPKVMLRMEGKLLQSRDAVFARDGNAVNSNFSILACLAINLSK